MEDLFIQKRSNCGARMANAIVPKRAELFGVPRGTVSKVMKVFEKEEKPPH